MYDLIEIYFEDDLPNNTIIDINQEGWMLGKYVLRYAKEFTSRKSKPPEPESETAEDANSESNDSENDKNEDYIA